MYFCGCELRSATARPDGVEEDEEAAVEGAWRSDSAVGQGVGPEADAGPGGIDRERDGGAPAALLLDKDDELDTDEIGSSGSDSCSAGVGDDESDRFRASGITDQVKEGQLRASHAIGRIFRDIRREEEAAADEVEAASERRTEANIEPRQKYEPSARVSERSEGDSEGRGAGGCCDGPWVLRVQEAVVRAWSAGTAGRRLSRPVILESTVLIHLALFRPAPLRGPTGAAAPLRSAAPSPSCSSPLLLLLFPKMLKNIPKVAVRHLILLSDVLSGRSTARSVESGEPTAFATAQAG